MRNFIQPGECITLTAPEGGVVSGRGCKIGQLFVVAANDAAAGAAFSGCVCGVFELPKLGAQAWTEGALVYWDAANARCTTVAAGNLLIGCAVAAAANPSATGIVRLNGIALADEAAG
jgi:predicted RecA/RadA family phage recombinase